MLELKHLVRAHPARPYQSSDWNSFWPLSSNLCASLQRPLYIAGAQEMFLFLFLFFFEMTQKRREAFFFFSEARGGDCLLAAQLGGGLHPW